MMALLWPPGSRTTRESHHRTSPSGRLLHLLLARGSPKTPASNRR
jgi:hypothetical protein